MAAERFPKMPLSHLFDVLIIGGGYSGAALAIRLSREARRALSVGVIEPREDVGKGVAYSAVHPDYRLNGPDAVHIVMPDRPNDFHDWLQSEGILEADVGDGLVQGHFLPGVLILAATWLSCFRSSGWERHRYRASSIFVPAPCLWIPERLLNGYSG